MNILNNFFTIQINIMIFLATILLGIFSSLNVPSAGIVEASHYHHHHQPLKIKHVWKSGHHGYGHGHKHVGFSKRYQHMKHGKFYSNSIIKH